MRPACLSGSRELADRPDMQWDMSGGHRCRKQVTQVSGSAVRRLRPTCIRQCSFLLYSLLCRWLLVCPASQKQLCEGNHAVPGYA